MSVFVSRFHDVRKFIVDFFHDEDEERNLVSAGFHMFTITVISMSMVDLTWFSIDGDVCVPYVTLGQFFWFGYAEEDDSELDCIDSTIVNLMRTIILLCFTIIILCLIGFYIDLVGARCYAYTFSKKYGMVGITVIILKIMTIIALTCYCVMLILNAIKAKHPKSQPNVYYGLGFYLIAVTGGLQSLNLLCTLVLPSKTTNNNSQEDDDCLIDGFEDCISDESQFRAPTPPPPYSLVLPPPPYTP